MNTVTYSIQWSIHRDCTSVYFCINLCESVYNSPHSIAVYDLGGGTFDISILEIQKGVFEVYNYGPIVVY